MPYIFTITPKDNLDEAEREEFQDEIERSMGLMCDILNNYQQDIEVSLEGTNKIKISLSSSDSESFPITLKECKQKFKDDFVFSGLFNPYDQLAQKIDASLG